MRMLELLENLRAQSIKHGGDAPVVLGVEVDGEMMVNHIGMIGSVTNQYGEIAVCLAVKELDTLEPTTELIDSTEPLPNITILPKANGEMLTDL